MCVEGGTGGLETTGEHGTLVALCRVKRRRESKAGSPPLPLPLPRSSTMGGPGGKKKKPCLSLHTIKSVKFEHAELTKKPLLLLQRKQSLRRDERQSGDGGRRDFSVVREEDSTAH